jgi:hypothetical protein
MLGTQRLARFLYGAPGKLELPPLPPEGERHRCNGANSRHLPRNFNVFHSSRIALRRLIFREVLPFCCHGALRDRAFPVA